MRKNIFICTLFLISFVFLFTGCGQNKTDGQIKTNSSESENGQITEITIAKLPSPPVCKQTTDQQEIQTLVDFLEGVEKTPRAPAEENGWVYQITLSTPEGTRQYAALGHILRIDDVSYQVSDTFLKDLETIYQNLDAQEERFQK